MKSVTINELEPSDVGRHVIMTKGQGTLVGYNRKGMTVGVRFDDDRVRTFQVNPNTKILVKVSK